MHFCIIGLHVSGGCNVIHSVVTLALYITVDRKLLERVLRVATSGILVDLHVSGGCNDSWCCDFGTLYYCRPEAPGELGESTQSSNLRYTLGHC